MHYEQCIKLLALVVFEELLCAKLWLSEVRSWFSPSGDKGVTHSETFWCFVLVKYLNGLTDLAFFCFGFLSVRRKAA